MALPKDYYSTHERAKRKKQTYHSLEVTYTERGEKQVQTDYEAGRGSQPVSQITTIERKYIEGEQPKTEEIAPNPQRETLKPSTQEKTRTQQIIEQRTTPQGTYRADNRRSVEEAVAKAQPFNLGAKLQSLEPKGYESLDREAYSAEREPTSMKRSLTLASVGVLKGVLKVGSSLLHPIQTAKNTLNAASHPVKTIGEFGTALQQNPEMVTGEVVSSVAVGNVLFQGTTALKSTYPVAGNIAETYAFPEQKVISRVSNRLARSEAYSDVIERLEKNYGKESPEVKGFIADWNLAFKKLNRKTPPNKEFSAKDIEAISNSPEAVKIMERLVKKYKPEISGSSVIAPQTSLEKPPRGTSGDIDVQDVRGGFLGMQSKSKEFAFETYSRLKEAGYDVRFSESSWMGRPKYHVTFNNKEFLNVGTSSSYQLGQIEPTMNLFDINLPQTSFVRTPAGVKLLNLRDQMRVKIQKGYIEGTRPKDIIDVQGVRESFEDFEVVRPAKATSGRVIVASSALSSQPDTYSIKTYSHEYSSTNPYSLPLRTYSNVVKDYYPVQKEQQYMIKKEHYAPSEKQYFERGPYVPQKTRYSPAKEYTPPVRSYSNKQSYEPSKISYNSAKNYNPLKPSYSSYKPSEFGKYSKPPAPKEPQKIKKEFSQRNNNGLVRGFITEIKKKGSWRALPGIRSETGAKNYGAKVVDITEAASFRIRPSGMTKSVREESSFSRLARQFRNPIRQGREIPSNVYIEKNKFRISTQGEKERITLKGLMSRRKKW